MWDAINRLLDPTSHVPRPASRRYTIRRRITTTPAEVRPAPSTTTAMISGADEPPLLSSSWSSRPAEPVPGKPTFVGVRVAVAVGVRVAVAVGVRVAVAVAVAVAVGVDV